METQSNSIPNIPAFTLYRLNSQQLQTCFESKDTKIICSIVGPYYAKSHSTSSNMLGSGGCLSLLNLQPNFNVSISIPNFLNLTKDSMSNDQNEQSFYINDLQQQINMHSAKINKTILFLKTSLKSILSQVIYSQDYQRMSFDVSFTIVEINIPKMLKQKPKLQQNLVSQMLLTKMVNLLSYTMLLANIQIKFTFSGALVILNCENQRISWIQQSAQQLNANQLMFLSTVFEQRDKQLLFSSWRGQYKFAYYEKMLNYCENACSQINQFIAKKIEKVESEIIALQTD